MRLALLTPHARLAWLLGALIVLSCGIALGAHLLNTPYIRLVADDFCFGYHVQGRGVLGTFSFYYSDWMGRYTTLLFSGGVAALPGAERWLMWPSWGALWAAQSALLWQLGAGVGLARRGPLALTGGLMLTYVAIVLSHNRTQSYYWIGGLANYVYPFVLLSVALAAGVWAVRAPRPRSAFWGAGAFGGLCLFLAAGTGENYTVTQLMLLIAGLVAVRDHPRPRALLLVGVFVTLLGLLIVAAAPGNANRLAAENPDPLQGPLVVAHAGRYALSMLAASLNPLSPLRLAAWVMTFGVFWWAMHSAGPRRGPRWVRYRLLGWGALGVGLLWAGMLPVFYGLGGPPPARAMTVPLTILAWWTAGAGALVGMAWSPPRALLLGLCVLALLPLLHAAETMRVRDEWQTFAQAWDIRDENLRQAPPDAEWHIDPLPVSAAQLYRLSALTDDRAHWLNRCMADYYGVASLRAGP